MKYRPAFPSGAFQSIEQGRDWVTVFVHWYNNDHLHSAIRFVTPADRHSGRELEVLERRTHVYEQARARHPERCSGNVRNWQPIKEVILNPNEARMRQTG
jgi:hypothetical protein